MSSGRRRGVDRKFRKSLFDSYGTNKLPCVWCQKYVGLDDSTIEHIIPFAFTKVEKDEDNCRLCCNDCNWMRNCITQGETTGYRLWQVWNGEIAVSDCEVRMAQSVAKQSYLMYGVDTLQGFRNVVAVFTADKVDVGFYNKLMKHDLHKHYVDVIEKKLSITLEDLWSNKEWLNILEVIK